MPIQFLPKELWGGLTSLTQPLTGLGFSVGKGLADRTLPENINTRAERNNPESWINRSTMQWFPGTPQEIIDKHSSKLQYDPKNPGVTIFSDAPQPGFVKGAVGTFPQEWGLGPVIQPATPGSGTPPTVSPTDPLEMAGMGGRAMTQPGPDMLQQILMQVIQGAGAPTAPRPDIPGFQQGGQVEQNQQPEGIAQLLSLLGMEKEEVPIMAHPGEVVLRKEAVDSLGGPERVDGFNRAFDSIPRAQEGLDPFAPTTLPAQGRNTEEAPPAVRENAIRTANWKIEALEKLEALNLTPEQKKKMADAITKAEGSLRTDQDVLMMGKDFPVGPSDDPAERATRRAIRDIGEVIPRAGVTDPQRAETADKPIGLTETPPPPGSTDGGAPGRQAPPYVPPTPTIRGPAPLGMRGAGSNLPLDWQQVMSMDPGAAAQLLQQMANTQGQFGPNLSQMGATKSGAPPSMELFTDLMNQFQGQVQPAQVTGSGPQIEERRELEARASEAGIQQNLASAARNRALASGGTEGLDPVQQSTLALNQARLRQVSVTNRKQALDSAQKFVTNDDNPENWKRAYRAQLMYELAINPTMANMTPKEIIDTMPKKGYLIDIDPAGREPKFLSVREVEDALADHFADPYLNSGAEQLSGFSAEDVMGMNLE